MTGKITAIVAAVVLIASAGVAPAQPKRHVARVAAPYAQTPGTVRGFLLQPRLLGGRRSRRAGPSRATPSPVPCSRA